MNRIVSTGIVSIITFLGFVSVSIAFCPVSFLPGNVVCEGQGKFEWSGPSHPSDIVDPNSQKSVSIQGGCPPYSWSVSGDGYWLENDITYELVNTVYTDSNIDCLASITVLDRYGNQVTGNLRSSGRWVRIGSRCDFPGPATKRLGYDAWYKWQYERVVGKYRQYQTYSSRGFGGTCLHSEPPCGNQAYSCNPQSDPGFECITLESTGLMNGYDRKVYPCVWQSPEAWSEATGNDDHSYCTDRGAIGWTSMACFQAGFLRLEEWQCD